ncbi:MAG: hypothetical protein ABSC55_13160 [Syntrophorhabdales bacterium]|jgi:hypothetical protein
MKKVSIAFIALLFLIVGIVSPASAKYHHRYHHRHHYYHHHHYHHHHHHYHRS